MLSFSSASPEGHLWSSLFARGMTTTPTIATPSNSNRHVVWTTLYHFYLIEKVEVFTVHNTTMW
jgi:hypothetical protein